MENAAPIPTVASKTTGVTVSRATSEFQHRNVTVSKYPLRIYFIAQSS